MFLPYNPKLVDRAKLLRANITPAEKRLWYEFLRTQQPRWLRQRPILEWIVDFYCPTARLVVEVDGETHLGTEAEAYDRRRTEGLHAAGLYVIRFENRDVLDRFEQVCETILEAIQEIPPTPLGKGGDHMS